MVQISKTTVFFILSLGAFALSWTVLKDSTFFLASMNAALILSVVLIIITISTKRKTIIQRIFLPKVVEVEVPVIKEVIVEKPKKIKFVGHVKTKKFHMPGCFWAEKIAYSNLINFVSLYEARKKKYRKCATCLSLPKTI